MNSIYYIQQRIKQQQDYIEKLDRDKKASDDRYKELRENAEIIQKHWECRMTEHNQSLPRERGISQIFFLNIRCEDENQAHRLYERFISEGLDVTIYREQHSSSNYNDELFTYLEKDRRVKGH